MVTNKEPTDPSASLLLTSEKAVFCNIEVRGHGKIWDSVIIWGGGVPADLDKIQTFSEKHVGGLP